MECWFSLQLLRKEKRIQWHVTFLFMNICLILNNFLNPEVPWTILAPSDCSWEILSSFHLIHLSILPLFQQISMSSNSRSLRPRLLLSRPPRPHPLRPHPHPTLPSRHARTTTSTAQAGRSTVILTPMSMRTAVTHATPVMYPLRRWVSIYHIHTHTHKLESLLWY